MNKLALVKRAEAQLKAAFGCAASSNLEFRHWRWRVGILEHDIVLREHLAFERGEHVLFTVAEWSKDLPVQAFSFKNNIVTGLFFNDIREVQGANMDLSNLNLDALPAVELNEILGGLRRSIYSDILKATRMHWGQDAGVALVEKNVDALMKMALRPGRIPEDDEIAYKYPGADGYIPREGRPLQTMKMSDLEGAKPLDGLNWFLVGPEITLRLS